MPSTGPWGGGFGDLRLRVFALAADPFGVGAASAPHFAVGRGQAPAFAALLAGLAAAMALLSGGVLRRLGKAGIFLGTGSARTVPNGIGCVPVFF